jgi:RsiW-degrading membrane proteinase PrsW (M82 family)
VFYSNVILPELILLFVIAFLPPIIYVIWIRNTEKYHREKWNPIFLCFIWGATIAIIAAIVLELILHISLVPTIDDPNLLSLVMIIIIAPFAEELTKPLALRLKTVRKELDELEDGLIYGAVAGLGFSATENLLYGWSFMAEGLLFFFILISLRSFGGCLLHASATAWTGYGYGKTIMKHSSLIRVLPYFLLAILVHAFYNSLLSFDILGAVAGLFAALTFTIITIQIVRIKIRTLDKVSG